MTDIIEHVAGWLKPVIECACCGTKVGVTRRQQNTLYKHEGDPGGPDDPNYVTLCEPCHDDNDAYWQERWQEYYSGLL